MRTTAATTAAAKKHRYYIVKNVDGETELVSGPHYLTRPEVCGQAAILTARAGVQHTVMSRTEARLKFGKALAWFEHHGNKKNG